jgi:hypothetical protein
MAPRSVRFGVRSRRLSNIGQSLDEWPKINYLELLRVSEGTFSLCIIHKEDLCPSSGNINRLMMMMMMMNQSKPT